MSESKTPRVDAAEWDADLHNMVVNSDFARQLETELAASGAKVKALEHELGCTRSHPHENMGQVCELKTVMARERFQDAAKAHARTAALEARLARITEALRDCYAGLQYIRDLYGDLYGVGWDRAIGKARAALAKQPEDGMVLVPREPTEEMIRAACDCQDADPEDDYQSEIYYAYKAMLAAREGKP